MNIGADIKAFKRETAAVICHENPFTSFGRTAFHLKQSLEAEYDTEIIWLVTPKYFPPSSQPPPESRTARASNFITGRLTFGGQLRRLLSNIRPSRIILINQFLGFLIPNIRAELPDARVGVFVHDVYAETEHPNLLKRFVLRALYNFRFQTADVFLYNSRYTESEARRVLGLPAGHSVVGFPVDRSVFRPLEDKAALRSKYGLCGYSGVCLNVSFDNPRKNIKTFFALAKARPDIVFARVGRLSPWMEEWLAENRVNNVRHFSGLQTEQLAELYNCADLFVFPSFSEGFGAPPLEALACGVPAVAADGSALGEIFGGAIPLVDPPDNVSGYLKIIDDVMSGKDIVDRRVAEKLLGKFSIESFGGRVRSALR